MASAQNAIVGFPSWRTKSTFTGGSWNATYPVTNLGILPLTRVARSTDATLASTQFIVTFDQLRPVGLVALVAHNCSAQAQVRYRFWQDTARTVLLYDTGFNDVLPISFPWGSLPWGDPHFWSGKYTAEDLAGVNVTSPTSLPILVLAAAMTVEISDAANSDGYVQIGVFEPAQMWQFSVNPLLGFEYGIRDRSITTEALGGAEFVQKMPSQRVWQGSIDFLPHGEAMGQGFEFNRRLLTADPFIWWLDPLDTVNQIRNCVLARNSAINNARRVQFDADEFPLNLKEVIG